MESISTIFTADTLVWIGIAFCITQSAIFSGLNLAFFSIGRLQLEVEAKRGNENAAKILRMREDSNFLLSTILWGNVSINVLLTMLSDMVLAGVAAFAFSTVAITYLGEIIPQAYFSRNALKVAAKLTPVIRFYQFLLFPVAKLTALMLDGWLGREGITYFRERELKGLLKAHVDAEEADVEHVHGTGALNFLSMEDITVSAEGEPVDPASIISAPCKLDLPILPERGDDSFKTFMHDVNVSGHKWVIICDETNREPRLLLDADGFLRSALLADMDSETIADVSPYHYCHRPIVLDDANATLGRALELMKRSEDQVPELADDDVIDRDVILLWSEGHQRVLTGADILGRLLKGIAKRPVETEVIA